MDKKNIILQSAREYDIKGKAWKAMAEKYNYGNLITVETSPMFMFFYLLKRLILKKKTHGVIFRYLNDYKGLPRTLLRALLEYSTIKLAKLSNVKVGWICHNIDQESVENYPRITQIRRKNLLNNADKFFVTDSMLVKYFCDLFEISKDRVEITPFGKPKTDERENDDNEIVYRLKKWKKNFHDFRGHNDKLVGLWIGNPDDKKLKGLQLIPKIIEKADLFDYDLGFIIVGPIKEWLIEVDSETYRSLRNCSKCKFIAKEAYIPSNYWPELCDFVWKVYNDYSVPYTIYNSTYHSIPFVTLEDTFLSEVVEKTGIGCSLSEDLLNTETLETVVHCRVNKDHFFKSRSWKKGAKNIFKL